MKKHFYFYVIFGLFTFLLSCANEKDLPYFVETIKPNLPEIPYNYKKQNLGKNFKDLEQEISNTVDDNVAALGRVLFYDKHLSKNSTTSCASCHQLEKSFSDTKALSLGFEGKPTIRNSSTIVNLQRSNNFFWDGRQNNLSSMVLEPVGDHIEMGLDKVNVLEDKLQRLSYYPALFEKAFGSEEISIDKISTSLTHFVKSIASTGAKANEIDPGTTWGIPEIPLTFNAQEKRGADIFFNKGNCGSCHNSFVTNSQFRDIGLDKVYVDLGRGNISKGEEGLFKVPTLQNIELTSPYMHDGRYKTLEEVVDHYSDKIQDSPNLSWELSFLAGKKDNFTAQEKKDLIAFLKTFTDKNFVNDPKFSDPFK